MLAAWLTGASLSRDATSFADNQGGSPRTGQFFVAIDPGPLAGPDAAGRMARLFAAITGQEGARLPGSRREAARLRTAAEGVTIGAALHRRLLGYAETR
jgi:(2R)-3-sulfolactate dehydrogenase (NADP+)